MPGKKITKHIHLLSCIDRNDPESWFPIYLDENEQKIMEESPYYVHNLESIDNDAFRLDMARIICASIRPKTMSQMMIG